MAREPVLFADPADAAMSLGPAGRAWLTDHLTAVTERFDRLPAGRPRCVIHRDAGRASSPSLTTAARRFLLDVEGVAVGRPEWDLISMAVEHVDFARITEEDRAAYDGPDVVAWPGFRDLADAQELPMTAFALGRADTTETRAPTRPAPRRLAARRGGPPMVLVGTMTGPAL